ncbi:hypothetical protein MNBD_ALPHA11-307 [hydrothermal vent metagenome]|uniref:Uncharacterized protein n=1 Tax=hydrothermal vent metagenome TaxID=652676 RepID=A0A3B0TV88_9ZZZZ
MFKNMNSSLYSIAFPNQITGIHLSWKRSCYMPRSTPKRLRD